MLLGVIDASASDELHHITSIAASPNNRMNPNNWLALCRPCHEAIEHDTTQGLLIRRWSDNHYDDTINA